MVDSRTGAALISRRPKIGTEAYACQLFLGITEDVLARYEEIHGSRGHRFEIPAAYRTVLRRLNGASVFELNLYGLPPSMCQNPPLLDRATRQPLDLATANVQWAKKYAASPEYFHFGSGPHSAEEYLGYFLHTDGSVVALLRDGQQVSTWLSIQEFLTAELPRSESQFEEFESRMVAVAAKARKRR